jgi:hypothetical protein
MEQGKPPKISARKAAVLAPSEYKSRSLLLQSALFIMINAVK